MSKIIIKSKREIALMKEAGIIMIELFDYLESITKEGLTTQYPEYNQKSSYNDFPTSDILPKQKIKDMNSSTIISGNAKLWR